MNITAESIIARNDALKSEASNFRVLWQDAADYIAPRKGQILTQRAPGEDQAVQLFDRTAGKSNLIFAAGMLSQVTPPGEIWARIESAKKTPSEAVKAWFDRETQELMEDIHNSNFYLAGHECFIDLGAFCTTDLYLEESAKRFFLNFCNVPVGSFVVAEDNEGMVDTLFKEFKWTARQAAQQWGKEKLGKNVREALDSSVPTDADKKFTFIQAIFPRDRDETKQGLVDSKLRTVASYYVCVEDKLIVEESGYYEMPHNVCRLMRSNNEPYGRGPGIDALPSIKLLNRKVYDLVLALEKGVNPSWLAPEDAAYRPDNRPNGVTYWDTTNANNKPEQLESKARVDWVTESIREDRELMREEFFVDMWQMLNRPEVLKHQRTAFQISEMIQEKLVLFAPFFARVTTELLSPSIQRAFSMRLRAGRCQPPPAEMGDAINYKVVFTSKIAMAIRAAQDNSTSDMLQLCSLMAPFDQSVPMVIKWRDRYRAMCRNRGIPAGDTRSDDEIDQMIAQMQQAEAAMKQAEQAKTMSETAANLGPEAQQVATNALAKFK